MATTSAKPKIKETSVKGSFNLKDMEPGNIFSENPHYTLVRVSKDPKDHIIFKCHETGEDVGLSPDYVEKYLKTANQYSSELTVGKEDKFWTTKQIDEAKKAGDLSETSTVRVGDLRVAGIRTIWEGIHGSQVFTVCFGTQPVAKTAKALAAEKEARIKEVVDAVEKASKGKTGVAKAATKLAQDLLDNPVLPFEEGHERILHGYKVQFSSRDGKYDCVDMVIEESHNIRPVNINTIKWLVFDGTRYIVD